MNTELESCSVDLAEDMSSISTSETKSIKTKVKSLKYYGKVMLKGLAAKNLGRYLLLTKMLGKSCIISCKMLHFPSDKCF